MSINQHWGRWIFSSICKHVDDNKGTLALFIEGQERDSTVDKDHMELRIDGPYFTEQSKHYWKLVVEVNILVQGVIDDSDFHKMQKYAGKAAYILSMPIDIKKYGSGVEDDDSSIGCLQRIDDMLDRERLVISHFGKVEPASAIEQSTVEAHYEMFLES